MKWRATWAIFGAGLVAWLVIIGRAASPSVAYLPAIAAGPSPTPFDASLIKLVDQDCGFVNAVSTTDGRVFVDYQTRPDGKVHMTEFINNQLVPRSSPFAIVAPAPAAELPGPKQGSVSQVVVGNALLTFYTGRADNDPSGPFFVWVLIEPIPVKP